MSVLEYVMKVIDDSWEEQVGFLQKLGRYPSTLASRQRSGAMRDVRSS
ncbi:hypothetical protein [Brevibacillus massiliensis]|jgi:hypothetical protein|nr:hypothetical protein [Brevibacillus massiliensis]